MPRSAKESEDEFEIRGRRTRASALSVTDSPLRRSTRNRQITKDDSSPESVTSDGTSTRAKRRRTPTLESTQADPVRNLRSRKTSTTSDVSEATESDTGGDGRKRTTRRSSMATTGIDTPTKVRLRRTTRAGSESKTLSPMVRVTRRTRASSVDPDSEDRPTTPSTFRKQRASVHLTELPVVEEMEKVLKHTQEDDEVFVMDEPEPVPTTPAPPASDNVINTPQDAVIAQQTSTDTRQKLLDVVSKDIPKVLVEKTELETSPGKENEKTPRITNPRSLKLFKASATDRKSLNSIVLTSNIDEKVLKPITPNSKHQEKIITLENDLSEKNMEDKEGSIIFIDDTDTDEADRPVEVFRQDKTSKSVQNDDEIIIAPVSNDDMSPCKSQTPEGDIVARLNDEKQSQKSEADQADQGESNLKSLFKDIPAEDWQRGTSKSPVNVEDEDDKSDEESDLELVGKGWSADENDAGEKRDNYNYDSDDTVIVQKKMESGEGVEENEENEVRNKANRGRRGSRKSLEDSEEPEANLELQEQLNRSRDLIYGFESGRLEFGGLVEGKSPREEEKGENSEENYLGPEEIEAMEVDTEEMPVLESQIKVSRPNEENSSRRDTSRRSSLMKSSEGKSPGEISSAGLEVVDESKGVTQTLRVSLEKIRTPVKEREPSEESRRESFLEKMSEGVKASQTSLKKEKVVSGTEEVEMKDITTAHDEGESSEDESEAREKTRRSLRRAANENKSPVAAEDVGGKNDKEGEEAGGDGGGSGVDEILRGSRKSLRRSATQAPGDEGNDNKILSGKEKSLVGQEPLDDVEDVGSAQEAQGIEDVVEKSNNILMRSSKQNKDDEINSCWMPMSEDEADEVPSEVSETLNKSRKSLRRSLTQPKQKTHDEKTDDEEETPAVEETLNTSRKSLRRSLTQSKQYGNNEKKSPQKRESLAVEKSSSDIEDEPEVDEEAPEVGETLNTSRKSLRRSLNQSKQYGNNEKKSPQKRESLAVEKSSLDSGDELEVDEEAAEVEATLNTSRRSLRKSLTQSKQYGNNEKKSQKRESLVVEKSSDVEDELGVDEEAAEVEEVLNTSRRSLRKSLTQSKQYGNNEKKSPQKRESLAVEKSSSDVEDEPEDEKAPEVGETLNTSRKSLRRSLSQSTQEANNDKKSPQKRESLAVEKSSPDDGDEFVVDEEAPKVKETLNISRKSLKSSMKLKSPSNSSHDNSIKSEKRQKQKYFDIDELQSSSDEEDEPDILKKKKQNLSTVVMVNSESEMEDVSEDSDVEQSRVVPSFLYGGSSGSSDDEAQKDIEREYNLNGDSLVYSDEDVPGDDLDGSESELSSDEDDGHDLHDFINDDEEEDEESDDEENDDENEKENEEENDEENEEENDETVELEDEESELELEVKPKMEKRTSEKRHEELKLKGIQKKSKKKMAELESSSSSLELQVQPETVKKSMDNRDKIKSTLKGLPLKKPGKNTAMNLTMILDDSELVDMRTLMKEKLNDSMPILKMKRLSSRRSTLEVLSEERPKEKMKEKKKKSEENKQRILTAQDVEEPLVELKKTKKKVNSENSKRETIKRKKQDLTGETESQRNGSQGLAAGSKRPTKRLPEEILENLPDVPSRPMKKRKINHDIFMPTRTMFDDEKRKPRGLSIDDAFVPLSMSGGTTSFEVVSLKKNRERKNPSHSFKEKMMNRARRQPMSAYVVYQQKLQASGKNKY
ncbi:transcriptional regulator ATRX [Fopius arisanus]|uniref:Transcriptional regulator ATRX n=1 Tax=Fopius arisanus TaxID=64838 RepID=A0A9R1U1L5_9HYME|nr:PREDICTED: transcriptional regulator ATRX-like [Fopius arisanus]